MSSDPPTLEHMQFEHTVVSGLLKLIKLRHDRKERLPPDMHQAACKFAEAYLGVIGEYFPEEMSDNYQEIENQLDIVERLYSCYK